MSSECHYSRPNTEVFRKVILTITEVYYLISKIKAFKNCIIFYTKIESNYYINQLIL